MEDCRHRHPNIACTTCIGQAMSIVRRTARTEARNSPDAEDIAGEVMMTLLEDGFRGYDPARGPLGPWLRQVTRRRAISHYRSEGRRLAREQKAYRSATRWTPASGPSEVLIIVNNELAKSELAPTHKAAVLLKLTGHTYDEIATKIASTFGVVRTPTRWSQIVRAILRDLGVQLTDRPL